MHAAVLDRIFRTERARVLATTIRHCGGDFARAEEIVQDTFATALERWPIDGVPDEPRAWLITTARFKAIDAGRRAAVHRRVVAAAPAEASAPAIGPDDPVGDDRLRLLFTCCHPALAQEAQVALTLRTLGGLGTDEIARAFLVEPTTMAQRLVRAKTKISAAGIPFQVPTGDELPGRLGAVMEVIYLVFNEGYAATRGESWLRRDLAREAIRLGELLVELSAVAATTAERTATRSPGAAAFWRTIGHGEPRALLALMLLHDARGPARQTDDGDLVLLEDQDRSRWDHAQIARALPLVEEALRAAPAAYAVQAAIAALHAQAASAAATDWAQIAGLYAALAARAPSPVIELNRAVAIAMVDGPAAGLAHADTVAAELDRYHLLHATRADLLRRLGRTGEAARAYRAALALVSSEPERRFLRRRLGEVEAAAPAPPPAAP
ncbi:MAG: RNA polymerase subunit sigma-24 [Kofleriaceae bacterium]|nr:RNA polymerase subunit sigma-24 [Kofleriaceae bacterium]MBP6835844.1 RNA polymerase subunit sigma-24 [Kofleriaceae bacterium]MBP9202563.1 RNA polymerase subunit sigma-24 [Kofleriaceae bacterium]